MTRDIAWGRPNHHGRHVVLAVVAILVVVFVVLSVVLFIRPDTNAPRHSNAVVVLGGSGSQQTEKGVALVKAGYASTLIVSTTSQYGCPSHIAGVTIICFSPNPATTQGEARFAAKLAKRHHWSQIIVVPSTTQVTRARIRFERCYSGTVLMDPANPTGLGNWAYGVVYEWPSLFKALLLQRGC